MNVLKGKLTALTNILTSQASLIKLYESICMKLKDRLQSGTTIDKKLSQINMHVLLFYKDFELMVKECSKDLLVAEVPMLPTLKEQINGLLSLTDGKVIEELNIENKILAAEYEEVMQNWAKIKDQILAINHKNSLSMPKLSIDDNSTSISLINLTDKNTEMVSPVSGSAMNSGVSSYNWATPTDTEYEVLRKDMLRLTEENKYLKKRVSSGKIGLDSKCQLCQKYVDIIDNLLVKHSLEENEYSEKINKLNSQYEASSEELASLKSKYSLMSKELSAKIENESVIKNELAELKSKKNNLKDYIKNSLDSSRGFEFLEDTVSSLSLALINKNDKDLSYKQKQLIRDLFEDSHIKVINKFKEKISSLESEKHQAYEISKKQTEVSKNMIKLARKYAIAIKEWVDIYSYIEVPITILDDGDTIEYFNKHAFNILRDFNDDINSNILQISEYSVELNNDLIEVGRFSNEFRLSKCEEVYSPNFNLRSPSAQNFTDRSQNLDRSTPFSDTNTDFMKKIFTTFNKESPFKANNSTDKEFSIEEQRSLLSALQSKDKEIQELKEKCKEMQQKANSKKLKKKKSKTFKKTGDKEKMIRESLEELQKLIDEEDAKDEVPTAQANLIALENNTINEADEKDEEETIFEKEPNAAFSSSLKSSKWRGDDKPKISVINYASASDGEDKWREQSDKLHHKYNFSIESESVRFDEDLLNDTLKLDEPMF